jgi:hypothetical protein
MTLIETLNPSFTTQNYNHCLLPIDYSSFNGHTDLEQLFNYDVCMTISCLRTLKCENYDSIIEYMNLILKLFESITMYEQYYLPFWWTEECSTELLDDMNKIHIIQFNIIDKTLVYSIEELLRTLLIDYLKVTRNMWHKYLKSMINSSIIV